MQFHDKEPMDQISDMQSIVISNLGMVTSGKWTDPRDVIRAILLKEQILKLMDESKLEAELIVILRIFVVSVPSNCESKYF